MKKNWSHKTLISSIILCLLTLIFINWNANHQYSETSLNQFQIKFKQLERQLETYAKEKRNILTEQNIEQLWDNFGEHTTFLTHIYQKDSLVFWSTKNMPVSPFANIIFPSNGLVKLQNGWYYTTSYKVGRRHICHSFLIKHEYAFENKDLVDNFSADLQLKTKAKISFDFENNFTIKDRSGTPLFALEHIPTDIYQGSIGNIAFYIFLILVCTTLYLIYEKLKEKPLLLVISVGLILLIRYITIQQSNFDFLENSDSTDPKLLAISPWTKHLMDYALNTIVVTYILFVFQKLAPKLKLNKATAIILLVGLSALFRLYIPLIDLVVNHTTIPLNVIAFFHLNGFSIILILSLGLLFFAFYKLLVQCIKLCKQSGFTGAQISVIIFVLICILLLISFISSKTIVTDSLFYGLLLIIISYQEYVPKHSKKVALGLSVIMLFSATTGFNLDRIRLVKDGEERKIYANKLALKQDLSTELEYAQLRQTILEDKYLKKFIGREQNIPKNDFTSALERRYFNEFWESYDMQYYLVTTQGLPLVDRNNTSKNILNKTNAILKTSGKQSEVSEGIFYVKDHRDQLSYIISESIVNKQDTAIFIALLRSKIVPEEIGFPRLLISHKANVQNSIENYSIARYHNGQLSTNYGTFQYPSAFTAFCNKDENTFIEKDQYNHYIYHSDNQNTLVLSSLLPNTISRFTVFSYLFILYAFTYILYTGLTGNFFGIRQNIGLAFKIQSVLTGIVTLSLLTFGIGSGVFVKDQYNEFTENVINEKIKSVSFEVKAKLGKYNHLDMLQDGNYMQYILQKFANVFFTDINLYDQRGHLMASSRPKIYNYGLISEQMDPEAFIHLSRQKQSGYIQQENIGKLVYASAYQPFYNNNGKHLGYINLQHFGQQRAFENQIEKFLIAIINVLVLLMAISVIFAVIISNWLTRPLRVLQNSFSRVEIGKNTVQISYNSNDEIGALVADYNRKIIELQNAAEKLAQSEREGAWREMAKQVAHEIKNPLTPMKLRIQQMQRTFDPNDPNNADKMARLTESLIEQIDALAHIANEFSSFARMPDPNLETFDFVELLQNSIDLFNADRKVEIRLKTNKESLLFNGDKQQFTRVLNNLFKNAVQAIPEEIEGKINVELNNQESGFTLAIQDNGSGIPEALMDKIFTPNFTTKSTGTGLGLAMVRQIVVNHQGTIDFTTQKNAGTTFSIKLPRRGEL